MEAHFYSGKFGIIILSSPAGWLGGNGDIIYCILFNII